MENEATSPAPQKKSSMMPIMIVVALLVIILIGVGAYAMNNNNATAPQTQTTQQTSPTPAQETAGTSQMVGEQATYKDGEYEAEGMYTSPGGEESIDVTLTLKDGVVEDAEVVSNATRPTSKQMQTSFIEGYKEQVIGKKIDEINLTKVSKSSLAPKGFNDAVEKIKAQAQA